MQYKTSKHFNVYLKIPYKNGKELYTLLNLKGIVNMKSNIIMGNVEIAQVCICSLALYR